MLCLPFASRWDCVLHKKDGITRKDHYVETCLATPQDIIEEVNALAHMSSKKTTTLSIPSF